MLSCPSCGEENGDRARFCSSCGAALAAAPASAHEERKVVSILFADLVGFTAKSDAADPEDVRAALRPYHARLKAEIERYGGTVEKFIGDAVMAVFSAPVAREDDAERAVRAALRIVEEMAVLNEEHPGLDLAVRVGVNTGEGLVNVSARADHGETLVTGDVVNTASRLQTVAPIGGVVVGEATYRTTKDVAPLDPVSLKGKAEPVPLWHAVRTRADHRRGIEASVRAPFVGREIESSLIQQNFHRTVRERSSQLVTITGEPGVGKSRLVWEFYRYIDDQPDIISWRQGRCLPYGEGISFWALGEIVKAQAGILESDDAEEVERKVGAAVASLVEDEAERDWIVARALVLVGVGTDAKAGREELFGAWRTLLEAMAASRPLVLVFEDLHWADDALLEFIEHLVEWSSGVPIFVLCTARPELYERHSGWAGGKRNAVTIALSPLAPEESDELISSLLRGDDLDPELRASIRDRSGGNPLYAEEFIRMVQDRRASNGDTGTSPINVPDSVHALIAARLDTLPSERKAILYDASVIGRVFWAGAVAHIAGTDEDAIRSGLHELSRKELVRPLRTSSVKDHAEYTFWHALVRDVAYGQIPRAPRAQKHRAAAEWIERLAGERMSDHAEVLVHHYREAVNLARAAGLEKEAGEATEQLRRYLVMAGERTSELDAVRSYEYLAEAIRLHPDDAERPALVARAAEAAFTRGDFDASEALAEEARAGLEALGDERSAARMILRISQMDQLRGATQRNFSGLEAALEILGRYPPSGELALANTRMGFALWNKGRSAEAIRWFDKGLAIAEAANAMGSVPIGYSGRGTCRIELGDAEGLDDFESGLKINLERGVARDIATAHNNLADGRRVMDGPAVAIPIYRQAIEFSRRRGLEQGGEWSASEMTRCLYDVGEWDELLAIADEIIRPTSRLQRNQSQGVNFATATRAKVLVARGQIDDDPISAVLQRAREAGDLQTTVPVIVAAAAFAAAHGNIDDASALVGEFERLTEIRHSDRGDLSEMVRIALGGGALELATGLVESTRALTPFVQHALASARALVVEAAGRQDEALPLYQEAAAGWESFGNVVERAWALVGAGRIGIALGDREAGTAALMTARETFSGLRAEAWIAEVDRLLG